MKEMKELKSTIGVVFIFLMGLSSCTKDNQDYPNDLIPEIISISINGSEKVFDVDIGFNTGVYANDDISGDLDESHFSVNTTGGLAEMSSYSASHNAGDKTATIRVRFTNDTDGNERINIKVKQGATIYSSQGKLIQADQSGSISTSGTVFKTIVIKDTGEGTGTAHWIANNTYILDGLVFVNDGQTLTIDPGTVIKGKNGQGEGASALIVALGGKIMAQGTADHPIIFTSEDDDLNGSIGDLESGKWGGLILLGKAGLNTVPSQQQIEGIPQTESRGIYGGSDDEDNSGILQYISIRHGGTDIGEGNEINGLTLGGVGSSTTIEYIEVFANKDDGVELFGGTARLKHILVAFVGDDSFDYDQGYRGYGQFWAGIQGFERGDRLGEHDGGTDPEIAEPYATPTIYNATYVGRGSSDDKHIITFRDNAGGHYGNSIFYSQSQGIDIELLPGDCSYNQFQNGRLSLKNNIFFDINTPYLRVDANDVSIELEQEANTLLNTYYSEASNSLTDPGFELNGLTFNILPSKNVGENMAPRPDDWFDEINYKGAFDSSTNWAEGWTLFSKYMNE